MLYPKYEVLHMVFISLFKKQPLAEFFHHVHVYFRSPCLHKRRVFEAQEPDKGTEIVLE